MSAHRKIFGVPLHKLDFADVKLSNGSLSRVPRFVSDACSRVMTHIDVEGLFRKAGSSSRQREIRVSCLFIAYPMAIFRMYNVLMENHHSHHCRKNSNRAFQ